MGSVSTIYNGVRQKIAGRALMDVAFSSTSTNGVQNKVIKAKFDEVDAEIDTKLFDAGQITGTDASELTACNAIADAMGSHQRGMGTYSSGVFKFSFIALSPTNLANAGTILRMPIGNATMVEYRHDGSSDSWRKITYSGTEEILS